MSNQIHPFEINAPTQSYIVRSESIVIGVPVYPNNSIRRCSHRLLLWCLIPLEIPASVIHLVSCMGCCGKFGNPITPLIQEIPYDIFYTDRFEKAVSCFTSAIYGLIHCAAAACTCCGCLGMSFSPAESLNITT